MTKWPSAKHFASWLGLSPNNRITGGKELQDQASANRASAALRLAANALHRSDSALGAFLRRKAQMGAPKAITATAHKLAASSIPAGRVDAGAEYYGSISAAGVAAPPSGGGLDWATNWYQFRRRGPHHVRTSRRANRRVTTLVSAEQSYARARPVQRRLTGVAVSGCVCSWRDVLSGQRPSRRWCILPVGEHGPGVLRR